MLYVSDADKTIKLTRGDTARLVVTIENGDDGGDYTISEDDILTLSVKKNISDTSPCFQKTIKGSEVFLIDPSDTENLEFGSYKYDVQLTTSKGEIYTIIEPSTFQILKEVTC